MSAVNDGGPAFQVADPSWLEPRTVAESKRAAEGMSLRDYFAAKAFAMLMHPDAKDFKPEETARQAYRFADAMLAARQEGGAA